MEILLGLIAIAVALGSGRALVGSLDRLGLTLLERVFAWLLAGASAIGSLAILLALPGWFRPPVFFPLLAAACLAALAVRRRRANPDGAKPLALVRGDLWLCLLLVALCVLVSRPFDWSLGGRDPAVYVNTAHQLARDGGVERTSRALRSVPAADRPSAAVAYTPDYRYPGTLFPGLYITDFERGTLVPQFYPLYPAFMAYAKWFAGSALMLWTTGLLAVGAVGFIGLLARRLAGPLAGVLAVIFLSTNLIQLWYGRYPNSEVATEFLLAGGAWAFACASRSGSRSLYAVAGTAFGAALLTRPDAVALIAVALVLAVWVGVVRGFDRALTAAAVPFVALALLSGAEAYAHQRPYLGDTYLDAAKDTLTRPWILALAAGGLALLLGALAAKRPLRRAVERAGPAIPVSLGVLVAALGPVGLAQGWIGVDWLGKYFTRPGLMACWAALAYLVYREWRRDRLVASFPLLVLGLATAAVYLRDPLISLDLPWGARRYLPTLVPLLGLAAGVAAADLARVRALRPAALLAAAALAAWTASIAAPSFQHRLWVGSGDLVTRLEQVIEPGSTVLLGPDVTPWNKLGLPLSLRSDFDVLPYLPTERWDLLHEPASEWAWNIARNGRLYLITADPVPPDLDPRWWFDAKWLTVYEQAHVRFSLPSEQESLEGPLPIWSQLEGEVTVFLIDYNRFN